MRLFIAVAAILFAASMSAHAHGIYTNLSNSRGQECCGGHDCAPVLPADFKHASDGEMLVRRNGVWYQVDQENVLTNPSPDGFVHACIWGGEVRCLLLPQMD